MFPESSDIGNVMGDVARKVGVAEAVLRLMVGLLTGKFYSSFKQRLIEVQSKSSDTWQPKRIFRVWKF